MNHHYLLNEARDEVLASLRLIEALAAGPETLDQTIHAAAIQHLRQGIALLQDEEVDFEIGETDD